MGLLFVAACLCPLASAQKTGTVVGSTPGSAVRQSPKAVPSAPKPETSSLTISCDSVADVMVTDPRGRRLGDDPKAHQHFDEIPNAYYEATGLDDDETGEADDSSTKLLFVPTPVAGDFKVTVFTQQSETYSCELLGYDNAGANSKLELNEIAAKPDEVQRFTVSFSGAPGSKVKATPPTRTQ